jgi:chlorobactene glucosyltransferase
MAWYHLIVLGGLLGLAGNVLLNLLIFRRPRPAPPPGDAPFVSILIPARNEEHRIRPCLESVLAQEYPSYEVCVLDDQSTDGTADLVESCRPGHPRLRLLAGEPLPEGWTGKARACAQLAREARGELLLFTDADTVHAPGMLAAAVGEMRARRADLLSLWPRQLTGSWSEHLILPFVYVLLLMFLPHWAPGRSRSLGVANGQFLLFRRQAYEALGGHGHPRVRGHLVEDVALGREIKVRGGRLCNLDGCHLVSCRMYRNFHEVWEGFTKNLRAGFEESLLSFLLFALVQVVFLLLPFFWACWHAWRGEGGLLGLALLQVTVIYAVRFFFAARFRSSWPGAWGHPFGQLLAGIIAANSWLQTSRGRVVWKGRTYKPEL